jgi:UDP-glucose 4-epimerase
MKFLVTGAGGFLGQEVVSRLLERGHDVRALIRPYSIKPNWPLAVDIVTADLRVGEGIELALDGIDCVLHLAAATSGNEDAQFASTVVGTETLLAAMVRSNVRRLVLVSSLVVYDWARAQGGMDEGTPLLDRPYDMGAYTIAKVWQERLVRRAADANNWDTRILRPGFIWGPLHTNIAGMGRRFGRLHFVYGPRARLPLTYVSNCADCIAVAAERPEAANGVFNIIDSDDISAWRYASENASRANKKRVRIPIPYRVGLLTAYMAEFVSRALFGKNGKLPSLLMPRRYEAQFKPVRFSTNRLRQVLKWTPPLSFEECLAKSYQIQLQ